MENVPWVLGGVLIAVAVVFAGFAILGGAGLILLGSGIALLLAGAMVRRTMLIFDVTEDLVELRRRTVLGMATNRYRLTALERARVETRPGSKNPTYRVVLDMPLESADPVPVTLVSDSFRARHIRIADHINDWLAAHRAA